MIKKLTYEKYLPYGIWIFFSYFTIHYAIEISNGGNGWKTGDWLINYSDGFIRRGLMGSILYAISDKGIPLLWLTYLIQVAIYAILFLIISKLYNYIHRSLFWLLILYSPAFLLFPFYDLQGGFRKEILVLTLFAYFCLVNVTNAVTNAKILLIISLYLSASLSHEITVFTLPFFLYLLNNSVQTNQLSVRAAITFSFIFLLISICVIVLSFLYKGSADSATLICNSLLELSLDPNICNGSISWLKEDTHSSTLIVIDMIGWRSSLIIPLFLLSFIPLAFTSFFNRKSLTLLLLAFAVFLPLFGVAIDWGRWLYILIFMFYCLLLSEKVSVGLPFRYFYLIVGLIYLTTWSIPHCCAGTEIGKGLIELSLKKF